MHMKFAWRLLVSLGLPGGWLIRDCHGSVGPSLGLELPLMLTPNPESVAKMGTWLFGPVFQFLG